jgi:16S rRNA (guanine527-N7)-methyltransferase
MKDEGGRTGAPRNLLRSVAQGWDLVLSDAQLDQFERYADALVAWNEHTNLTAITDRRAIVIRHFLDSLALAQVWHGGNPPASLADIGTGAGFPGLPLKILWPDLRLLLVESIGKKTAFLQHVVDLLELRDVEISTARAEDVGRDARYREQFAAATGRAVAALNVLSEYCLPLCRVQGTFVAPKSAAGGAEVNTAETAIRTLGAQVERTIEVELPDVDPRTLVVIRKIAPTPPRYPRRAGIVGKRPL